MNDAFEHACGEADRKAAVQPQDRKQPQDRRLGRLRRLLLGGVSWAALNRRESPSCDV